MSLTPPSSFKKSRAAWNAKTDAQRQKHIDFQLQKKTRKEALIKQRAQEAKELAKGHGVQGLFPDYEDYKDMSREHLADCEVSTKRRIVEAKQQAPAPLSFPDTSDETSVNQNVEEAEKESKRIAIGYKSYEYKMVQSAEVPFDLDLAVRLRLQAMKDYRDGLF